MPNKKYHRGLLNHVTKSPLPYNPVSALKDLNWKMAMDDEYNALIKNKTWDLVSCPPDVKLLMLFDLCEFSDIKKNLTVLLRGIKLVL